MPSDADISGVLEVLQRLAPMTIAAIFLMQEIWQSSIGWNEVPSDEILVDWKRLQIELPILEVNRILQLVHYARRHHCGLHGFCDAFISANAAVSLIQVGKQLHYCSALSRD